MERLAQGEKYYPSFTEGDSGVTAVSFAVVRLTDDYYWDFVAEDFQDAYDANSWQALTEGRSGSSNGHWLNTTGWTVPAADAQYQIRYKMTNAAATYYVDGPRIVVKYDYLDTLLDLQNCIVNKWEIDEATGDLTLYDKDGSSLGTVSAAFGSATGTTTRKKLKA